MHPGITKKGDSKYVRNGTCNIFTFIEPLGGIRHVNVCEHHTTVDWAEKIRYLMDISYPDLDRTILVMDNLNTHALSSLYKAFPFQHRKPTGLHKSLKSIILPSLDAGEILLK